MKKTFKRVIFIEFLIYLSIGLFSPSWYKILIERGQTIDQFGVLLGLMALSSVAAAYFAGWLCHFLNPFKVMASFIALDALVMLAFIPDSGLHAIYALQVLFGVTSTSLATTAQILVAKYSEAQSKAIGTYNSLIQGTVGLAMILSGFVSARIGSAYIIEICAFVLTGAAVVASLPVRPDTIEQTSSL